MIIIRRKFKKGMFDSDFHVLQKNNETGVPVNDYTGLLFSYIILLVMTSNYIWQDKACHMSTD